MLRVWDSPEESCESREFVLSVGGLDWKCGVSSFRSSSQRTAPAVSTSAPATAKVLRQNGSNRDQQSQTPECNSSEQPGAIPIARRHQKGGRKERCRAGASFPGEPCGWLRSSPARRPAHLPVARHKLFFSEGDWNPYLSGMELPGREHAAVPGIKPQSTRRDSDGLVENHAGT